MRLAWTENFWNNIAKHLIDIFHDGDDNFAGGQSIVLNSSVMFWNDALGNSNENWNHENNSEAIAESV